MFFHVTFSMTLLSGTLYAQSNATLAANLRVEGRLDAFGLTELHNTLTVRGSATITNALITHIYAVSSSYTSCVLYVQTATNGSSAFYLIQAQNGDSGVVFSVTGMGQIISKGAPLSIVQVV
jgi:hypothetical protein